MKLSKHLRTIALIVGMSALIPFSAIAGTHTWISNAKPMADGTLPQVTVNGNSIHWGSGAFDDDDFSIDVPQAGGSSLGNAVASARQRALDLSDLCKNPGVSSDSKNTASTADTVSRWLAATDAFITVEQSNMYSMYLNASKLNIIVDGKSMYGFKVTYGDGGSEVWVINPAHLTSSDKLFDTPAPGTLEIGTKPGCTAAG